MIQYEDALMSLVRTRDHLVKTITYNLGTFMLYYQKLITNHAEAYLNP